MRQLQPTAEDEVTLALAKRVVARVAAHEQPLFRAMSQAYLTNPRQVLASRAPREEMLGFGAEVAVALLTPVILDVTRHVVHGLLAGVDRSLTSAGAQLADGVLARWLPRASSERQHVAAAAMTPQQLSAVHDRAVARARELRLPDDRAELLANAIVGALATQPPA
jgi:hypothetical protein